MQSELRSIYDGWTKQCFYVGIDGMGGYCARGFPMYHDTTAELMDATEVRVAAYIQAHYPLPEHYVHPKNGCELSPRLTAFAAIIYANNELKLTPERFREIDRLTQYEQIQAQLQRRVDAIQPEEQEQPCPQQSK